MTTTIPFGDESLTLTLPDETEILRMRAVEPISDPRAAIAAAFDRPIGTKPLDELLREKVAAAAVVPTATIVIADHTRPVPYNGEQGILWPLVERLVAAGLAEERITVLVGTGTHHPLTSEIDRMLDPRILTSRVHVVSHDCRDPEQLRYVGTTARGTEATLNAHYLDADIRIATGLVESHFFAGASGGRKAICPGIVGEQVTHSFHSARMVASPDSTHLKLDGNPHHEESFAVASMAPPDFTVNVTLDSDYRLTGVFAGELDAAHRAAVARIREYVEIEIDEPYDIVLTHGGFVSINHYQAAKPALVAIEALAEGGWFFLPASTTDDDPVGSLRYRTLLHLLRMIGPDAFTRLLFSDGWTFLPDQWEVQAWAKVDAAVARDHFYYYSPQSARADYEILPGTDGNTLLPEPDRYRNDPANVQRALDAFVKRAKADLATRGVSTPRICFLYDGPYGIVQRRGRATATT
ncbi:MAG: nickel-dependent lactate racemase [Spirochaetota bacterium]